MAAGDIALRLVMTASAGQAISTITQLSNVIGDIGLGGGLALAAVAVDGLAVALGVTAVKAAGDFQSQTERLVTSADELQSNLDAVRQGLLQMSVDTGTSTEQLAAGMYYVESAGYHGAAGLQVMQAAAEGAKSENADLAVVSKALITEMQDYHMSADQSAEAMNGLIATVQNGTVSLQDLSSSLGQVLPIASSLGISFANVAGSIDTMTAHGYTARQAAMNLGHVFLSLSAPSKVAEKSMKDVGLSAQQVKDALVNQGLPEALQMIENAVGKKFPAGSVQYEQALKNILGGIMGVKVAATLTGDSLQQTEDNIAKVAAAMKNSKGSVMGFAEVQQTLNFRFDQAKQMVQALLIQLGTALIPIIMRVISVVGDIAQKFLQWFIHSGILQTGLNILTTVLGKVVDFIQMVATWVEHNQTAIQALKILVIGLAIAFGVILAAGLILVLAGMAAIAAVIAVVVAIIMGIIWVVQNWGTIWTNVVNWVKGVWKGFTDWLGSIVQDIIGFFVGLWNNIVVTWNNITTAIHNFVMMIVNDVVGFFQGLWNKVVSIWNGLTTGIKNAVTAGFNWVVNFIKTAINTVVSWFQWLYNHNYYFKMLVDDIKAVITILRIWLTNTWHSITTFIIQVWNNIVVTAKNIWNTVTTAIKNAVQTAWDWLVNAWNTVTTFLTQVWNNIVVTAQNAWNWVKQHIITPLTDAWNWVKQIGGNIISALKGAWDTVSSQVKQAWDNFTSTIKGAVGKVGDAVKGIVDAITNKIKDLINQATQWGKNLLDMFINGIKSKINDLKNTLGNIAGAVGSFLGFHSPTKEGAGKDADTWIPNLIKMLVSGLTAGVPKIQVASSQIASALVPRSNSFALSSRSAAPASIQPTAVYLDKRQVGQILFTYQRDEAHRQGNVTIR